MAQEFEQRQERQTEDGSVFTIHAAEQVGAWPLEAVGANAAQNVTAVHCQVGIEERIREPAHHEPWPFNVLPEASPAAPAYDRRRQDVRPTAQRLQVHSGGREISRLVEPGSAADQDLVGPDDQSVRLGSRDPSGLCVGEAHRGVCRVGFL